MSLCTGFITGLLIFIFSIEREKAIKAKKEIEENLQEEYENYQKIIFNDIDVNSIKLEELLSNPTNLKIRIYNQEETVTLLSGVIIGLKGEYFCNRIVSDFVKRDRKIIKKFDKELSQLLECADNTAGILSDVESNGKKLTINDITLIQNNLKSISIRYKIIYNQIGLIFKKAFSKLKISDSNSENQC